MAQTAEQKFEVYIDKAGIVDDGQGNKATWVYAVAQGRTQPSSGILVAWDCKRRMVRRLAHVVYADAGDGVVAGPIVEDHLPWVAPQNYAMLALVCGEG